MVPVALPLVDTSGHEARAVVLAFITVAVVMVFLVWVERLLFLAVIVKGQGFGFGGGRGAGWRKRCTIQMEAEQSVVEEVVEGCPGAVPVVC